MSVSGADWVKQFPTSDQVNDLTTTFAANVRDFLKALDDAGATVTIAATRRPAQRAYMMHYSWMIAKGQIQPAKVPAYVPTTDAPDPLDIQWQHMTPDNKPDAAASKQGAVDMVNAFEISHLGVAPALNSNHITGKAIDMNISWQGDLTITDAMGKAVVIKTTPRDGTNAQLIIVGGTYKVIHLLAVNKDKPHWSTNGY
ncbi:MAG TPA: hypothetical protein VGN16_12250 [Acidobacteriaceae bacterium]|jgi:hypothetical protein